MQNQISDLIKALKSGQKNSIITLLTQHPELGQQYQVCTGELLSDALRAQKGQFAELLINIQKPTHQFQAELLLQAQTDMEFLFSFVLMLKDNQEMN